MFKISTSLSLLMIILSIVISCKPHDLSDIGSLDTALIQKINSNDSLVITIYLKKQAMVHDPVSALKPPAKYIDSILLIVPNRRENVIKFNEVRLFGIGHYPIVSGGVSFGRDSIKIDLAFDNYDDKKIYKPEWNGTYLVKWIK